MLDLQSCSLYIESMKEIFFSSKRFFHLLNVSFFSSWQQSYNPVIVSSFYFVFVMAFNETKNTVKNSEEIIAVSSCNLTDNEINIFQKLSSVLLNEFNYLPQSRAVTILLVVDLNLVSSMAKKKPLMVIHRSWTHGYQRIRWLCPGFYTLWNRILWRFLVFF